MSRPLPTTRTRLFFPVRDFLGPLWQARRMALDKSDIEALHLLIREENRASEERLNRRFDEVMTTLDILVAHDEKREQENTIRE